MYDEFSTFLYHVTDKMANRFEVVNQWAVKIIVNRLLEVGELNPTSVRQIEKMIASGKALKEIQDEIIQKSSLSRKEVVKAFEDAAIETTNADNDDLSKANIKYDNVTQSTTMQSVLKQIAEQTMGEMENITRTMADSAGTNLIKEIDDAYAKVQSGMESYDQAISEAVENVAKNGLYVSYPSGHKDTLETAIRRALMTGINQGTISMKLAQMKELDIDTLITSQHVGARTGGNTPWSDHSLWQGKVFSISGKEYPNFKDNCGWEHGDGIGGWNCRHHINIYIEGVTKIPEPIDIEENEKVEKLRKEQRKKESQIRADKRSLVALKQAIGECTDKKIKHQLQAQYDRTAYNLKRHNQEYKDYCSDNGLKTWNERAKVINFERAQSKEARIAAAKYTNSHIVKRNGRDIIIVDRTSLKSAPNSIEQVVSAKGGITRNYYNSNGNIHKQISNNDHGHKIESIYGEHGEHAHDFIYNDKRKLVDRQIRNLTDEERKENGDIL